ncbi:hypothetical protein DPMN_001215 [Dreissena polymorpha]|uniref:Uncharacterized protein n=1 Tax=Dreissena polymorpha TaxID=45954 RepID=A0A9D4RSV7_DREPO|nr:hypothetical protein DPMN_001215 [Dreissena polymorpha]
MTYLGMQTMIFGIVFYAGLLLTCAISYYSTSQECDDDNDDDDDDNDGNDIDDNDYDDDHHDDDHDGDNKITLQFPSDRRL